MNQPYHISVPTEDQPYYTSSSRFIPVVSVQSTEPPQEDGTTPYSTPPESPSQIPADFNWGM